MEYHFDFKIQAMYGVISFLLVLAILHIFTQELNWISSVSVGVINFIVAGFYTKNKC